MSSRATYLRLLREVRPHRGRVGLALCASAVAAVATSLYAWLLGPLVEAVVTPGPVEVLGRAIPRGVMAWALPSAVVAVATVKALAQFLQNGLMSDVGQWVMTALRRRLYGRLLQLPPSFFSQRHSGDLLSRFTSDVAQVEFAVTQALSSWARDGLQVLGLLATCFAIDRRLFLFAFFVLPVSVLPVARFARAVKKVAISTQGSLGRLTSLASEQLQNLPVLQAYRAQASATARFDEEQGRYLSDMSRSLLLRGAYSPTLEFLGVLGAAATLSWGAQAVASEPGLAGKLVSFLAATLLLYQPVKALAGTFSLVVAGVGAAERLFEVVDAAVPEERGGQAPPLREALVFEQVHGGWAEGREGVRGLVFTVPAGKTVALVGSSGAGKSTTLALVLGFLEPSRGRILWDGVPTSSLSLSSVRAQLGWVPQEPVLFSGTVRDNLKLGMPGATDTEAWEALARAGAAEFVRGLAGGLDAEVGERGGKLSGGQRQRLAIARAFLRAPSLLLLDEPTSALDAESERAVQAGLEALMQGRTTLVVAHRLATVRRADLILVLEAGQVVESGTHAELSALGGRYAGLLRHGLDGAA
jgi:subfamily B ATP-binding cassette protein MsbA